MHRLRRLFRLSAIALAALVLCLAAAVIVIETDWFKNWLRLKLVTGLASVLDGELRVGRLSGSLWTGVTLDNLELQRADGEVLRADQIRVRYDPFTLARRRWIVDKVVIQRASIRVAETSEGWNVMHLTRPRKPGGKPPTVNIRSLELTDSTVTIDSASAAPRTLTAVRLDSSLVFSGGTVSMNIDRLNAVDSVTGLALRQLSGQASDSFRSFDVRFVADSPRMGLAGTARGRMRGTARVLEADFDASHIDLAQLLGRADAVTDITGHVSAQGTLPGAGDSGRIAFTFRGPGSRALGYAADRIDATGVVAGGAVTFRSNVAAYGAQAYVDGTFRWATPTRAASFAGRGTFASLDVRRLPRHIPIPRLDTRIAGRFETSVTKNTWRAHAILSGGTVEGAVFSQGTEGFVESVSGVTSYAAVGTAASVDVERFGRVLAITALDEPRFGSNLNGDFFVVGRASTGQPHLVTGGAILGDSTVSGTHVTQMNALAQLVQQRLVVTARSTFEGLTEKTLDLPQFPFTASGSAGGWFAINNIDLPVTEDNLEVSARADLGPSVIRDVALDSAVIDGRLVDCVLTLNEVDIRAPEATVTAQGMLGLDAPVPDGGIALTAELKDRTFLQRLLGRPVFGAGSVTGTITGTLASPAATGTLTIHEAAYADDVTALTASAKFTAAWPDRSVDRLTWQVATDAAFVTLGGTEIERVVATADGGIREMAIDVRAEQKARTLGIEGQLMIQPDAQELLLRRLALTTEGLEWSLPAGQQATVKYGSDLVHVTGLTLVREAQKIEVAGGFYLGTAQQAQGDPLHLALTNVDVADVNRMLLGTRQLTGLINGAVTVTGNRAAPVVDGDLAITNGTVQNVPYELVQARGKYADGIATVDAVLNQSPGASLRASGTIPVSKDADPGRSLALKITGGPVGLGLVQAFTTELDKVTGNASIDLNVTGSISDPMLSGTATVSNGAFLVRATGVQYQTIEAALDFKDGQMSVRNLSVADPTGDVLTAVGALDIRRGITNRTVDVQVRATSFSVLGNQFGNAEVNTDVRVSGEVGAPVVRGTVRLESGRVEVARLLEQTGAKPYATTPQAAPGADATAPRQLTPWEKADIAVDVQLPDNLVLRGRNLRVSGSGFGIGDMNIITGGNFEIRKPAGGAIDVRGMLEVVQGSYSFQGRRFEIERGSDVRFPGGGSLTDPVININATRDVSGVIAEVRLRGNARAPELTLSSRPPLDESDILSLIVFNQPVSALGSAEQVNLGQRAAAMAAGAIASPLADSIGRALNLDVFEIQAPTDDSAGSVLIGSQLGSRVLLGLRQQFGNSEASTVTLEYRVNKLLRFVTSVASGTLQAHATRRTDRGGVDLIFVIRY